MSCSWHSLHARNRSTRSFIHSSSPHTINDVDTSSHWLSRTISNASHRCFSLMPHAQAPRIFQERGGQCLEGDENESHVNAPERKNKSMLSRIEKDTASLSV